VILGTETFQKGVSIALTMLLAAFLVLAWVVTAPLVQWCVMLSDYYRERFRS
jgi:hypothetical protein